MGPVDQTSGTDLYGYRQDLAVQNRVYNVFLPNTYDTLADSRGSMWIPLDGKLTPCNDGKFRCKVECDWQARLEGGNHTVRHSFVVFEPEESTGTLNGRSTDFSYTASTNYTQNAWFYLEFDEQVSGAAVSMTMERRDGGSVARYMHTSLLAYKVLPYDL